MSTIICPDRDSTWKTLLSLLPTGRAWQNREVGGAPVGTTVMQRFWRAVAGPWSDLEQAICAGFDDMFCATANASLDLWLEEYGLPNACDPTGDDLCAKVAALGGESPAYWNAAAGRMGIVATSRYLKGDADEPSYPGVTATLVMRVNSAASFLPEQRPIFVGEAEMGVYRFGDPDTQRLSCTLEQWLPAHLSYIVEIA